MTTKSLTIFHQMMICFLLLTSLQNKCSAQRTIENQSMISGSFIFYPTQKDIKYSLDLETGRYHHYGQYLLRVNLCSISPSLDRFNTLPIYQASITGIYSYRILSSTNRKVNLYANIGSGLGLEALDPDNTLPPYFELSEERLKTFIPINGSIQGEYFLCDDLALTVEPCLTYYHGSAIVQSSLGIRLSLRYIF